MQQYIVRMTADMLRELKASEEFIQHCINKGICTYGISSSEVVRQLTLDYYSNTCCVRRTIEEDRECCGDCIGCWYNKITTEGIVKRMVEVGAEFFDEGSADSKIKLVRKDMRGMGVVYGV